MDFPFPPGSCQICGKFNHQTLTCYHRQNLGYRPSVYHQFEPQHGQSLSLFRPQHQALMVGNGSLMSFPSGPSTVQPSYNGYSQQNFFAPSYSQHHHNGFSQQLYTGLGSAPHYYQGYTPTSLYQGSPGASSSQSVFPGGAPSCVPSAPWYFDSGAISHVTNDVTQITTPTSVPSPPTVAVGNGQAIFVSHSGKGLLPTPTHFFI